MRILVKCVADLALDTRGYFAGVAVYNGEVSVVGGDQAFAAVSVCCLRRRRSRSSSHAGAPVTARAPSLAADSVEAAL